MKLGIPITNPKLNCSVIKKNKIDRQIHGEIWMEEWNNIWFSLEYSIWKMVDKIIWIEIGDFDYLITMI